MEIIVEGVRPWDGRYPLDLLALDFTTREWGWIKRLTSYMPVDYTDGLGKADPELVCVFAVIAMRRAGKIENADVPSVYERLVDAEAFSAVTLDTTGDQPREEQPEADPTASSSENGSSSGDASNANSEISLPPRSASGTVGWGSSG
jgi:hypothetical protein